MVHLLNVKHLSVACIDYDKSRECDITIKALSIGETVLTVTTPDGRSASANIMVEEEKLKLLPDSGYYYDDTCTVSLYTTLRMNVLGCTNPDPEKYYNGQIWLMFENSAPSVAEISYINTDALPDENILGINLLSVGETVFTAYSPDGRIAVLKLIVFDPTVKTTTTTDPTITTDTTEIGTSSTTIATYYDEHGLLVDEFGNLIVINGTSAIGSGTTIAVSNADNTTTTSVDNTITTTTEPVSSNPDDELPQTGNSNIFYKVVVGVASAMTITVTAMIVYSKKKDEE